MNSAAIRLRGSSVFCLRDAAASSFLRVVSVAAGVLRWMIRRNGRGGSSGPTLACTITSCASVSPGSVPRWPIRSKSGPSGRRRLNAFQPTRTMKSAWPALCWRKRCRLAARPKLRSPMRISPGIAAPRSIASAPCLSVNSRCEKPPRPRSYTACTRQSALALPRSRMQLPSQPRRMRPGQRTAAPGAFAASCRIITASRNSTDLSNRYFTPGSLIRTPASIVAQAAAWLSDSPPGPRASDRRNRVAPEAISRLRSIALVCRARLSRSRSAGSRRSSASNWSAGIDAVFCIRSQNQAESRRVKQ